MRKILVTMMILFGISLASGEDYRIISTRTGKDVSIKSMAKQLAKSDVVFFGEKHDDPIIHSVQHKLLPLLQKNKKKLIVSFEMFERDVQPIIDRYLAGEIDKDEFLRSSRPWGNYETDYQPLIEYAREHALPALAANIPREYASKVVRNGTEFLETLSDAEKGYIAAEITAIPGSYRDNFLQTMNLMTDHGMPGDQNVMDRLFYAQCMKDDTMAESIVRALKAHPGYKLIHFNGDFHSQFYLGTVERVRNRAPQLKLAVISYVLTPDPASYKLSDAEAYQGDFLIVITDNGQGE